MTRVTSRHHTRRHRANRRRPVCPTCQATPNSDTEAARLSEELQTAWWSTTDQAPGRVTETRHCRRCQPHTVHFVACLVCGDGPILAGQLAEATRDADPQQLPSMVVAQLTAAGWRWSSGSDINSRGSGWVCCR